MKNHLYHLVNPSPWPYLSFLTLNLVVINVIMYMYIYVNIILVVINLLMVIINLKYWFSDVVKESSCLHTKQVNNYIYLCICIIYIYICETFSFSNESESESESETETESFINNYLSMNGDLDILLNRYEYDLDNIHYEIIFRDIPLKSYFKYKKYSLQENMSNIGIFIRNNVNIGNYKKLPLTQNISIKNLDIHDYNSSVSPKGVTEKVDVLWYSCYLQRPLQDIMPSITTLDLHKYVYLCKKSLLLTMGFSEVERHINGVTFKELIFHSKGQILPISWFSKNIYGWFPKVSQSVVHMDHTPEKYKQIQVGPFLDFIVRLSEDSSCKLLSSYIGVAIYCCVEVEKLCAEYIKYIIKNFYEFLGSECNRKQRNLYEKFFGRDYIYKSFISVSEINDFKLKIISIILYFIYLKNISYLVNQSYIPTLQEFCNEYKNVINDLLHMKKIKQIREYCKDLYEVRSRFKKSLWEDAVLEQLALNSVKNTEKLFKLIIWLNTEFTVDSFYNIKELKKFQTELLKWFWWEVSERIIHLLYNKASFVYEGLPLIEAQIDESDAALWTLYLFLRYQFDLGENVPYKGLFLNFKNWVKKPKNMEKLVIYIEYIQYKSEKKKSVITFEEFTDFIKNNYK